MKNKYFPCPYCKGRGDNNDSDYIDVHLVVPATDCGYCEGAGMIEINGKRHMEIKRENIAIKALDYFGWKNEDGYGLDDLQNIGSRIAEVVKNYKQQS